MKKLILLICITKYYTKPILIILQMVVAVL